MKNLLLSLIFACLLFSCKKSDNEPEGYYPKVGDTYQSVIDNWGKPSTVILLSPAFNSDADNYYINHHVTVTTANSVVKKITKDNVVVK